MQEKTAGLVLREVRVGECDKLLTVLTATEGKITVKARGVLRKNSRISSACQLFAFSELELFQTSARWTVDEAEPVELFRPLRDRVEALALAAYVCEVLEALSDADAGVPELLRLGLNTLYALSEQTAPDARIKAVFELRAAAIAGYAPDLGEDPEDGQPACLACGAREGLFLCPESGGLFCRLHLPAGERALPLPPDAASAAAYLLNCDPKRIFSFRLSEPGQCALSRAAETYLCDSLGRGFRTLDYYRQFAKGV